MSVIHVETQPLKVREAQYGPQGAIWRGISLYILMFLAKSVNGPINVDPIYHTHYSNRRIHICIQNNRRFKLVYMT